MKIAITLCASLGGLIATVAGLAMLDELARGHQSSFLPQAALCWWLAVAWVPALAGLLLLFEKGGPAAALAFGSCPLGGVILALPEWKAVAAALVFCGFLTVAAGLSLISPAADSEGQTGQPAKPRPLLWLGGAVILSTLALAGLQIYFANKADGREREAEKIVREMAGIRGILTEVQTYKANKIRLDREVVLANEAKQSFRKLTALRVLDTVENGKDAWIESLEVTEHRFRVTLTAPSLGAAAAVQNRLSALPGIENTKISRHHEAAEPDRQRYVVKGDLDEEKLTAGHGNG